MIKKLSVALLRDYQQGGYLNTLAYNQCNLVDLIFTNFNFVIT